MASRRRIRTHRKATVVSGGTPTPGSASLEIGPSFGQSAGNDDSTWDVEVDGPDLDAVDLVANLFTACGVDLFAFDIDVNDLFAQGLVDLDNINYIYDLLNGNAAVDLDKLEFVNDLFVLAGVDLDAVDLVGNLAAQGLNDLDAVDLEGQLQSRGDVDGELDLDYANPLVSQDAVDLDAVDLDNCDDTIDNGTMITQNNPSKLGVFSRGAATTILSNTSSLWFVTPVLVLARRASSRILILIELDSPYDVESFDDTSPISDSGIISGLTGIAFAAMSPDGLKIVVVDFNERVYQLELIDPYDLTSISTVTETIVLSGTASAGSLTMTTDGTKLIKLDTGTDNSIVYTFSTAWDSSTADAGVSYTTNLTEPIAVSDDGLTVFIESVNNLDKYTLTSPFKLSDLTNSNNLDYTISYNQFFHNFSASTPTILQLAENNRLLVYDAQRIISIISTECPGRTKVTSSQDLESVDLSTLDPQCGVQGGSTIVKAKPTDTSRSDAFVDNGNKFISANTSNQVKLYDLSTTYDVSTSSLNNEVDIAMGSSDSLNMSSSGDKFILGKNNSGLYEFSLSPSWNLSSIDPPESYNYTFQDNTTGTSVEFGDNGNIIYLNDQSSDIHRFDLAAPYDFTNETYISFTTSLPGSDNIVFNSTGDKVYLCYDFGNDLDEYDLSTPWDLDSASLNTHTIESDCRDVHFKPDGTKLYVAASTGGIREYDLSPAWDISSRTLANTFSTGSNPTSAICVDISSDGSKMIIGDFNTLFEYEMAVPWDTTTLTYTGNSLDKQLFFYTNSGHISITPDGLKVVQYSKFSSTNLQVINLGTAWDLSSYNFKMLDINPHEISVNFVPDGTKFYGINNSQQLLYIYDMSTPFDIDTASLSTTFDLTTISNLQYQFVYIIPSGTAAFFYKTSGDDTLVYYELSTPWDFSTATENNSKIINGSTVRLVNSDKTDSVFSSSGTQMFEHEVLCITTPQVQSKVDEVEYTITEMVASADTWVGDTIACADDNANHDGEPLSVEGTVATAKKALIGWDLSNFPSNATLLEAEINLTVDSIPATDQTIELLLVAVAGENWDEATVKCDDKPAEDGSASSSTYTVTGIVNGGAPGDRLSFAIDTTDAFNRLAARMGTGRFSIYVVGASAAGLLMAFESTETAATNADAPTLTMKYTVPTT